MSARAVVALVVALAVAASAVGVIYSKHRARRLFVELQSLERARDQLNVEWGRLRLEQGAYATHGRVEEVARERIGLELPGRGDVIRVRLGGEDTP